jgi:hypothetical protein
MDKPRRSAGMRGSPANPDPEPAISATPKPQPEPQQPPRVSTSPHPKPKVLMGEVAAPKGQLIAAERNAFRAFMLRARLTPTRWARDAGVGSGEILAFLSGHARSIAPETAEKLARAANVSVETLFR